MTHATEDRIRSAKLNREKAKQLLELSRDIQQELNQGLSKLNSARNWGLWDLLGGGMISAFVKHSKIDDAMNYIERTRPMLEQLAREVDVLGMSVGIGDGPGGFAIMADFLFDGLFADLYVQSKIKNLQADVIQTLEELERVDRALIRFDNYEAEIVYGTGE